jgi:hypothetical protein
MINKHVISLGYHSESACKATVISLIKRLEHYLQSQTHGCSTLEAVDGSFRLGTRESFNLRGNFTATNESLAYFKT